MMVDLVFVVARYAAYRRCDDDDDCEIGHGGMKNVGPGGERWRGGSRDSRAGRRGG